MQERKVVIIGHGIAGITALIKLKQLGYSPVLLSKGAGATTMFSGSFDIASTMETKYLKDIQIPIIEQIKIIKKRNKYHPYNYIRDIEGTLYHAMDMLKEELKLPLSQLNLEQPNHILPTQSGYLKESAIVPESSINLTVNNMMNNACRYGILNFSMFKNFFYNQLMHNLLLLKNEKKSKSTFHVINFDFLKRSSDTNLKNYNLAHLFEKDDLYKRIIDSIVDIAKKEGISHIISPAVWGVEKHAEMSEYMHSKINMIETISTTPSIAGIRLQKKINQYIKEEKIEYIPEKAVGFTAKNKKITSIITDKGQEIKTSAIILATGKYLGGGINTDKGFRESLFDLPLFYHGEPISPHMIEPMFETNYFNKHKAFSIGVKINENFQVLNIDNKVLYHNIFAAGNILSDYNYIAREGGFGVAIATGYIAAKSLTHII